MDDKKKHEEDALDEALRESFPASDPIAVHVTPVEARPGRAPRAAPGKKRGAARADNKKASKPKRAAKKSRPAKKKGPIDKKRKPAARRKA